MNNERFAIVTCVCVLLVDGPTAFERCKLQRENILSVQLRPSLAMLEMYHRRRRSSLFNIVFVFYSLDLVRVIIFVLRFLLLVPKELASLSLR
jgi:hypothetical protein